MNCERRYLYLPDTEWRVMLLVLNEMHKSYHDGLGGNGDLDVLMHAVNTLPLK